MRPWEPGTLLGKDGRDVLPAAAAAAVAAAGAAAGQLHRLPAGAFALVVHPSKAAGEEGEGGRKGW